jgi:cell division protein FtsI (penicillin-binding protein 3)
VNLADRKIHYLNRRPRTRFEARPWNRSARPTQTFHLEETRQVRVGLLLIFFILGFAVLAVRAFQITILKHAELTREAENNYRAAFGLTKPRGEMLDCNGERLAITVELDSVDADPKIAAACPVFEEGVAAIAKALSLDPGDVRETLTSPGRFERLKTGATEEELSALAELDKPLRLGISSRNDNGVPAVYVDAKLAAGGPRLDESAAAVARILSLEKDYVLAKITQPGRFEWLKRRISPEESAALDKIDPRLLQSMGVRRKREPARRYPFGALAASVLGFTSTDNAGGLKGAEGLEAQYETLLSGQPGSIVAMKDAKRRSISPDGVHVVNREEGRTLRLTIDARIQLYAETALDNIVALYKPKATWAIVIDVPTGEIRAMANRPTFDPNHPADYEASARRNHALLDMYEPGSTMKPLTMAVALANGRVRLDEQINCAVGSVVFAGKAVQEAHHHSYGVLTPAQIIQKSSNVGAAKLALRCGAQELFEGFQRLGVGLRTNIDYPWESPGRLRKWQNAKPVEVATQGFGQGVTVTSMQLLNGMCALGNGGRLMRPHLVAELLGKDGQTERRINPEIVQRAVPEEVAGQVLYMMTLVTEEGGTGKNAKVDNFKVAGKTGTAQKVIGGRYSESKYIGSFVGLVPGDDPKLGIIVVVDEPQGASYGGVVAAPAFREIAERSLDHLQVFSDKQKEPTRTAAKIDKNPRSAAPATAEENVGRRVYDAASAPNFLGLTMRAAGQLAADAGVSATMHGTGVAVRQSPEAGKPLTEDRRVTVEFALRN